MPKLNLLVIIGSATPCSSNERMITYALQPFNSIASIHIFHSLQELPHFNPFQATDNPPTVVVNFRNLVAQADVVLFCTPEYIFSIPSALKNAFEWCVATTVFTDKKTGIITASAHGQKAHEEMQLILQTLMAKLSPQTNLLIQGVKGKVLEQGELNDEFTQQQLHQLLQTLIS